MLTGAMGSLPNLHALSSADSEISLAPYLPRTGPHRLSAGHGHVSYRPAPLADPPFMAKHHEVSGFGYPSPISLRSCHSVSSRGINNYCGRRDSLSSASGTSVRRLIALVRATPSQHGPTFSERALARNHAALCLAHATFAAAMVPLFALQSSSFNSSVTGGALLSLAILIAAITSLASPIVTHKVSLHIALVVCYSVTTVFFALHLYSSIFTYIPAYVLLGLSLGPLRNVQISLLMNVASKLSFVTEEPKTLTQARLARQFYLASCVGHAVGSAVTGFVLWYTVLNNNMNLNFELDVDDHMICGSASCPGTATPLNSTEDLFTLSLPCKASTMLYSIYLGCSVMAITISATFLDKIPMFVVVERTCPITAALKRSFKDVKLALLAPFFVFIGWQQAFIMVDYSKSYVVCGLGIPHVGFTLAGMGLLQAVAGCTLSLLLQHVSRPLVTVVGLVFHACLLFVLLLWRPSRDDAALFYVICASWGVCNAIWETLEFAILTNVYSDSWPAPVSQSLFYRHLGFFLGCAVQPALCVRLQLYGLVAALSFAIVGLTLLERRLVNRGRRHYSLRRTSSACSHTVKGLSAPL